ncbi:MAG: hypothetical protein AAGI23_09390 [Bacteroidota bacterium]
MSFISASSKSSTTIAGDVIVEANPPTSGTLNAKRKETDEDRVYPPGALFVSIKPVKGPITVNNETVSPESGHYHLESRFDAARNEEYRLPQISIVANGEPYWIMIAYSDDAGVNLG